MVSPKGEYLLIRQYRDWIHDNLSETDPARAHCSDKDEWQRLRPDTEHALRNLNSEISSHEDPQTQFEAYTYAKDITARAIQARMLMHLPTENRQLKMLRELRELGFGVHWHEIEEISVYSLRSLDLDFNMIPAVVRNKVKKSKSLTKDETQRPLKHAGIPENG